VWYVSDQHAMELLLHVSTERVVTIATAVMHTLVLKTLNCKAGQIVTDGQSCPFCLLALDKNIPESSSKEDHKRGKCVFKDRIKRVLLYKVSNIQDKGESARKLLDGCLRDNEVWYEQIGKNLRIIEVETAVLEHDKTF